MNWIGLVWKSLCKYRVFEWLKISQSDSYFTECGRKTIALARMEAYRLGHDYVGSEHILLALLRLRFGVTSKILHKMGLNLAIVREAVRKHGRVGYKKKPLGNVPFTERVKQLLVLADEETNRLNHPKVGSGHILLGLQQLDDGEANRVLNSLGVDLGNYREEILSELRIDAGVENATISEEVEVPDEDSAGSSEAH